MTLKPLTEWEVVMSMFIAAETDDEAERYAKETLREVAERDIDGPGAQALTNEPWLVRSIVRDILPE